MAEKPSKEEVKAVADQIAAHALQIIAEKRAALPAELQPGLDELERVVNESVAKFTTALIDEARAAVWTVIKAGHGPTAKRPVDLA